MSLLIREDVSISASAVFCSLHFIIHSECAEQVLPEAWVRFYAAEAIVAVAEVHALGYIHRDLKPGLGKATSFC